jgi:hypothetical protein
MAEIDSADAVYKPILTIAGGSSTGFARELRGRLIKVVWRFYTPDVQRSGAV